jgi:hypothetical protein
MTLIAAALLGGISMRGDAGMENALKVIEAIYGRGEARPEMDVNDDGEIGVEDALDLLEDALGEGGGVGFGFQEGRARKGQERTVEGNHFRLQFDRVEMRDCIAGVHGATHDHWDDSGPIPAPKRDLSAVWISHYNEDSCSHGTVCDRWDVHWKVDATPGYLPTLRLNLAGSAQHGEHCPTGSTTQCLGVKNRIGLTMHHVEIWVEVKGRRDILHPLRGNGFAEFHYQQRFIPARGGCVLADGNPEISIDQEWNLSEVKALLRPGDQVTGIWARGTGGWFAASREGRDDLATWESLTLRASMEVLE